jgi:Bacterial SH3 domain
MHRPIRFERTGLWMPILWVHFLLLIASTTFAQTSPPDNRKSLDSSTTAGRVRFTKAFIVDDRLSALRREADMKSQVIHRLRLGRPVFIIESKGGGSDRPKFYRVAVTRRTRGWVHESSLVIPSRPHEDERLIKLVTEARDGLDRIALCRLFLEHFSRSPIAPRALLALAEEADHASSALSQNARKRLKDLDEHSSNLRDYYLNDTGLDRYSRLGITFDFKSSTAEYVYDGKAYREIVKRFPHSDEAQLARKRLDSVAARLARQ